MYVCDNGFWGIFIFFVLRGCTRHTCMIFLQCVWGNCNQVIDQPGNGNGICSLGIHEISFHCEVSGNSLNRGVQ